MANENNGRAENDDARRAGIMPKNGSLVVVGSGIKSVGHLTLETKGWIEQSDIVVYCVADPATEVWIKKHSRAHFDLYTLYGNDKKRIDTYNDMVQVMLDNVRAGRDTCAVFYGHPGVFVLPTHKAIGILRAEGYPAVMLPGISALDCLWADLGVDPSTVGSQTYEATDMLLRQRAILPDGHVVIWQIGCIGDLGFNFAGYDCRNLDVLVEYLERFYPPTHEVTHYQGSQYPMCPSKVDKLPLSELRNAVVTGISTLYIPPLTKLPTHRPTGIRLGLLKPTPAEEAELRAKVAAPVPAAQMAAPAPAPAPATQKAAPPPATQKVAPVPAPQKAAPPPAAQKAAAQNTAPAAQTAPPPRPPSNGDGDAHAQASARREKLHAVQSRRTSPFAQYMHTPAENGLADFIAEMMEDPRVLARFLADPNQGAAAREDLTLNQRRAVASLHAGRIRMAMKNTPEPHDGAAPAREASVQTSDGAE